MDSAGRSPHPDPLSTSGVGEGGMQSLVAAGGRGSTGLHPLPHAEKVGGEGRRSQPPPVPYPAAALATPPAITCTAQYLNSGILPTGSSAALVSKFAAAS